jgi:subtilisin family serine protease
VTAAFAGAQAAGAQAADGSWGAAAVGAPAARALAAGAPAASEQPTVCVIDTGIDYTHPALAAAMHPARGWNALADSDNPMDDHGHGTHAAGTVAGTAGAGAARVLACKFLDAQARGVASNIVRCLDYCVRMGAAISINSYTYATTREKLGTPCAVSDAIAEAGRRGHLYVTAAGNGGVDADAAERPVAPAAFRLANVLSVAALERAEGAEGGVKLAPYSNFGAQTMQLAAPGSGVASAWPGGGAFTASGTSAAAPFVAAAAALLSHAAGGRLSGAQLRAALVGGARPLAALEGAVSGGMLDVEAALRLALAAAGAQPAAAAAAEAAPAAVSPAAVPAAAKPAALAAARNSPSPAATARAKPAAKAAKAKSPKPARRLLRA